MTVMRLLDTIGGDLILNITGSYQYRRIQRELWRQEISFIIVDPKERKILDILKDRKQENLSEYFKRSRKLLFAKYDTSTTEQKEELKIMYWYSDYLRITYLLK